MSGEHKASSAPIPVMLRPVQTARPPSSNADAAEAETTERKKLGFAASFDQLVVSNLRLVDALHRFIRVAYWLLFALMVTTVATNLLLFLKR